MENENLSRLDRQTGHAELVSASSTQAVKSFFTKILCRGTGITKRQTPDYNLGGKRRGFTLIELLVVVLIIGILAAVAVPQYQKAVEKSRAVEGIVIMKNLIQSINAYYMEYGEYPKSLSELDIPDSFSGRVNPYHGLADWRSNKNWSIGLFNAKQYGTSIMITKTNGKYKGTGFSYAFYRKNPDEKVIEHKFICHEYKKDLGDVSKFAGSPGDYCEKILQAVPDSSVAFTEFHNYLMP